MDIRNRETEGIILHSRDWREQDKLLTLISPAGPEKLIARGARKPGGALCAVAQPFSRALLLLTPPKAGLSFLSSGQIVETYLRPGDALERYAYAAYLAELLLAVWPEGKAQPALYYLAQAAFSLLKLDDDFNRTARFFELRLLQELGWLPPLDSCAACGRSLLGGRFQLSPGRGALLCLSCADSAGPPLSAGSVETMRRLLNAPLTKIIGIRLSAAIQGELEQALAYYLDYHLDYKSKVRRVLDQLLD